MRLKWRRKAKKCNSCKRGYNGSNGTCGCAAPTLEDLKVPNLSMNEPVPQLPDYGLWWEGKDKGKPKPEITWFNRRGEKYG